MSTLRILYITLLACFLTMTAEGKEKKTAKPLNGNSYARLERSFYQRTIYEREETMSDTSFSFNLLWLKNYAPQSFFWRWNNSWMNCTLTDNNELPLAPEELRKGTRIKLFPLPEGKFRMPDEIKPSSKKAIFFQNSKGKWYYITVDKFKQKEDIIQP